MTLAPVIAVVGPSGVGKDSVIDAVISAVPGFVRVRRVITRPSGAAGEDFDSVTDAQFDRMRRNGEFAIDWRAHGLSYGIPVVIETLRIEARAVVVNLSRTALCRAQDRFADLRVIALSADADILAARLAARGREDAAGRARRLSRTIGALPPGLRRVVEIDNSGPLEQTVAAVLVAIQPVRV